MSNEDEVIDQPDQPVTDGDAGQPGYGPQGAAYSSKDTVEEDQEGRVFRGKLIQWSTDGTIYIPCGQTKLLVKPGAYEINRSPTLGIYFEPVPVKLEKLLRFPDASSDKVIDEIRTFWAREDHFKHYGIPFKRGILLYGPAGSGKSSTVKFVMDDVIRRDGVVIIFQGVTNFIDGMRVFRQIQPSTPVVVVMEDIDAILEHTKTSALLNVLDGVNSHIERIVFLATTNYPERLEKRVSNRPSRFDKRFKIGFPSAAARRLYLETLFKKDAENDLTQLDRWVEDTDGFSIAHLKELFVAVKIIGNTYDEALTTLNEMNEQEVSSEKDDGRKGLGFAKPEKRRW
jgi:hypothetical protein